MTDRVVDASAIAAIVFQEAEEAQMRKRLRGLRLCAPPLLRFEIANVCLKKIRREPARRLEIIEQHDVSLNLPVEEFAVDTREVRAIAEDETLSAYDASYLWLARRLGVELVTLDQRLQKAAARI
ncbi:MAG: type II toxin-antitoxin system VapC family toxin [Rhizomicrobium sp.]